MKKRLLSILLVLVMVIGIMPVNAIAADIGSSSSQTENYGEFIDGEQVLSDMIEKNGMYTHPRIIMSEERFAKLKTSIGDDSVTAILLEKLLNEANRLLNEPVSQYEIPDGIRLLETSKRIQRRVAALAMAYNIFEDEKYAQRCYAELEAACNFKDWNPSHFLDTAEMSTAFALGYDWLYHWMNDEQRAFLRNNMIEKGLMQVMEDYEDKPRTRTYRWYQDYPGDNWKLVCNGSMNMAALAIGDEADARDIASEVLTYAYKEAYSFVRRAYSEKDGTYSEGLGYWDYATYYLGLYSSSLTSSTGTDYSLADFEGLRKSVDFVRYMSSNTPKSFSFGDDGDSRDTGWAVLLWLGEYFQSYDIAAIRLKKIKNDSFNYLDLLWIDEDKKSDSAEDSPTDWGSVGASNASFRNTWDESGIVAALHVGTNNYKYHGHYDLGSFYIESNGARFFTDLGNEQYELPNRQYSYRIRAEGHNTLVINPSEELDQQEGSECLISSFSGGNEAYAVTDLTAAYEPSGAESVLRGLKMIKDKECVVIQDEISLNAPGDIYWFAHTKGEITIADDGKSAVVTVGSEKLWVGLISDDGRFTVMNAESLSTSPVVPNQTDNSSYRKLAVHLTNTRNTTISVACIPLKQGEIQPSWIPSIKTMSEWTPQTPENVADVVAVPEADDTVFAYNGKEQTYTLAESKYYTISDNTTQTNAGTYIVTVALKDKDNVVWNDGTTDDKEYTFTIKRATPTVVVSATPAADIAGKTISATAIITNPNNASLFDTPTAELTYSINGVTQPFTGSFVIPEDTAEGTLITITATTTAYGNYAAGIGSITVPVTSCTHENKTLMSDADSHWYECLYCGADIDKTTHSGGKATCNTKASCGICNTVYGEFDSANHADVMKNATNGRCATCAEEGYTGDSYCLSCQKVVANDGEVIPKTEDHNIQVVNKKNATQEEEGYTGDKMCIVCNKVFEQGTVIDKLQKEETTNPSENDENSSNVDIVDTYSILNDAYYKTDDNVNTVQYKNGSVKLVNSTKAKSKTYKVPDTVTIYGNTFKVTEIDSQFLKENSTIQTLKIGKNVKVIGKEAFKNCKNLKTVTLGKNVTTISDSAFEGCKKLKKITIPSQVTKIGKKAFYKCTSLKKITIKGKSLKKVGKSAFTKLAKKTTIKVPKSKKKAYKKLIKVSKGTTIK